MGDEEEEDPKKAEEMLKESLDSLPPSTNANVKALLKELGPLFKLAQTGGLTDYDLKKLFADTVKAAGLNTWDAMEGLEEQCPNLFDDNDNEGEDNEGEDNEGEDYDEDEPENYDDEDEYDMDGGMAIWLSRNIWFIQQHRIKNVLKNYKNHTIFLPRRIVYCAPAMCICFDPCTFAFCFVNGNGYKCKNNTNSSIA